MGFIIIGLVMVVLLIWIEFRWDLNGMPVVIAIIVFFAGLILGLELPGTPYEMTYQTPIVSLSDGMYVSGRMSGGLFPYVCVNTDNSYSYYYEVDSEYKQTGSERSYKQGIVRGNVTIIEYDNTSGEIPALYMYESGAHGNFWTFSVDTPVGYKYVFRVPKGTVVQQFELNGR